MRDWYMIQDNILNISISILIGCGGVVSLVTTYNDAWI